MEITAGEYYAFITGAGTAKTSTAKLIQSGTEVPVSFRVENSTGRILVYNDNSNQKIGFVTDSGDPTYQTLVGKEPKTNKIIDSKEIYDILSSGQKISGFAVAVISVTTLKVRFEISEAMLNGASTEAETSNKEFQSQLKNIDLSAFSDTDRKAVEERLDYIKSLTFERSVLLNISKAFVMFLSSHKDIKPFVPCFVNTNQVVETAVKNILTGSNLCLTGPKGTGKNKMVEHLCRLFDLSLCDMQMSYDTAKEEVRGEPTIAESGKVEVRLSNILVAAQTPAIICLDEANMARGSITSLLHSATDHRRYMEVPGFGVVYVHSQARFIITMNEGDEYEGTREMNSAFRDRFHEIVFTPNSDNMAGVFQQECGLNAKQAKELNKFYKLMFSAVYENDDNTIPAEFMSQRKFVRAGQMLAMGFVSSVAEAVTEEVVNTISDTEIRETLKNLFLMTT